MQGNSRSIFFLLSFICCTITGICNNVLISNVSFTPIGNGGRITFDISWENSWRLGVNNEFHDAVWVFVKYAPNGGPQWLHADIQVVSNGAAIEVIEPNDTKGAFIRRANQGEGTLSPTTVTFDINNNVGLYPDFKVFGIEMVYSPLGPFYLGDGASPGRFHRGDDTTSAFYVQNSLALKLGTNSDQIGALLNPPSMDIPATYPNGYDAFYCMKYNVSQEQYAEFLNTLDLVQQNNRTNTDLTSIPISNNYVMTNTPIMSVRQSLRCDANPTPGMPIDFYCDYDSDGTGNEVNDGQNIVLRYVNVEDILAYLDWAALRPMTELEYEKICRGPLPPVAYEYAWGSSASTIFTTSDITFPGESTESVSMAGTSGGLLADNNSLATAVRCGFSATPTSSRILSGAGYYGVLDLSGNGNEVVFNARSSANLNYTGTLGDGMINATGYHNVTEWSGLTLMIRGVLSPLLNHHVSDRLVSGGISSFRNGAGTIRGVR